MNVRGLLLRTKIEEYEKEGIMDKDHHDMEIFDLIWYCQWQVSATFTSEGILQLMIFRQRK